MKSWEYIIQTRKEHIDFINKIVEAYDIYEKKNISKDDRKRFRK